MGGTALLAVEPGQALIGRCTGCRKAYRAELPGSAIVCAGYATPVARNYGYPTWHDCRAGIPCPLDKDALLPACGFTGCDGHDRTPITYKPLKVTYKPGAACGPGNCGGAVTATCVCSCNGKNHGSAWLVSGGLRPLR